MKRLALLIGATLLGAALFACGGGGGDDAAAPTTPGTTPTESPGVSTPTITAVGDALGMPSMARIGPAGGTVSSGDGQVVLEVPPGALGETVDITLTPITRQLPSGRVGAWRFEPHGLVFQQPATLRVKGLSASEAERLRLATQDASGQWIAMDAPQPGAAGELLFAMPHFSDWGFYERWYMSPETTTARAGETVVLKAFDLGCDPSADAQCDMLTPLAGNADVLRWTVNGVPGGSAGSGTLSATRGGEVVYTAPASPPADNPVAVTATLANPRGGVIQLVAHIRVLPAESHWQGEVHLSFFGLRTDRGGQSLGRHQVLFDSSYQVHGEVTDAMGDDGAFSASLLTSAPTVDYRYQYGYKEPGYETLTELESRRVAPEVYDGLGWNPVIALTGYSDGTLQFGFASLQAFMDMRGQRTESSYDGTNGQTTVQRFALHDPVHSGPDLSGIPTGVWARHPITGAPLAELPSTLEGQRVSGEAVPTWAGESTLENVPLVFEGQTITGTLKLRWRFSRVTPP
ncbi:MAG: hypothetical protein KF871_17120 [Hydrogenophaga sp.]|uniref:hypothetical protein n=1 Tax=Hydrogenophaga sp. TaxID=1904254 RepID=UPI001E0D32AE|nr:hypothetical protein [Hydrogenophaga sp.]MBX3611619.1 hypothetical protein [Hydrogenophaga sp.]